MTEETTPIERSTEAPAAAATTVQPVERVAVKKSGLGRAWWILSSAAGVALLVIGLLGGILIGQTMHGPGLQNRAAHAIIERGQPDRLPQQRLKERFQQRQQSQKGQRNQQQQTPPSSAPSTGSNG